MIPITESPVAVFTVPTDAPESDGTLEWTSTTIVIAEVKAGRVSGLGYTYGARAIAALIHDLLFPLLRGRDAMDVAGSWVAMTRAIRNQGRPGISSMAIAAVDAALWDVRAFWISRSSSSSAQCGTRFPSTAAADSHRTRLSSCSISSLAGSPAAFAP